MSEKRWRLLKAVEHNWGLIGPGDWTTVQWNIYHDGSYEIISTFNPDTSSREAIEEILKRNELPKPVKKKKTGKMNAKRFSKLREAIKLEPWRDPSLEVGGCDGEAWEIKSYRADGSTENTSGRVDYIYGHRVLEKIVDLLPEDGNLYDSSAYISVSKRAGKKD
ncbi:MAG: hypothetical protein IKS28_03635 [Clostridia bacterium]|nr:hypothetical protein [Clostridia bacterium]